MSSRKMAPSPGRQLLVVAIILTLCAVVVFLTTGCAAYEAVVSFFESSDAAAKAAEEAAKQAEDTMHSLEHALWLIPAYIAGEARRPMWGKFKNRKNGKKKAA